MGDFDEWQDYNFMWTQWKSNRIVQGLKTYKEVQKEDDNTENPSQASTFATDKESGSSTENLIHTPKRHKNQQLSALKKQDSTSSNSK